MDNFQDLLKEIKQDGLSRRKDSARTNELLEQLVVSFKGFKKPKEGDDSSKKDKPFSLREDFEKFKGELKDSFSFVKKGIMGTTPSGIGSAGLVDGTNVRNTPAELMADETEKQTQTINELLNTTTESLTTLKKIGFILEGSSDQLKLDKEENKIQNDVLKELKKLNEVTAENVAAGAAAGGGIDIDLGGSKKPVGGIPEGPDKKDKKPDAKKPGKAAAAKGLGKSLLKKIPVVGAVAGLAFGASRLVQGDVAGAGMEVASGLAGTIPGVGTAASVGIDAALAAKDAGAFDKEEAPAAPPPPPPKKEAPAAPPPPPPPPPPKKEAPAAPKSALTGDRRAAEAESSPLGALQFLKSLGILPKGQGGKDGFVGYQDDQPISKEEVTKKITAAGKDANKVLQLLSEMGKPGPKVDVSGGDFNKTTGGALTGNTGGEELAPAKSKSSVTEMSPASKKSAGDSKFVYDDTVDINSEEGKIRTKVRQYLRGEEVGKLSPTEEKYMQEMDKKQRARGEAVYNQKNNSPSNAAVSSISNENAAMRDEMSGAKGGQTAVMNNVSNNTQTTFMPIKGEPRPGSRGSALDRYSDRVAAY